MKNNNLINPLILAPFKRSFLEISFGKQHTGDERAQNKAGSKVTFVSCQVKTRIRSDPIVSHSVPPRVSRALLKFQPYLENFNIIVNTQQRQLQTIVQHFRNIPLKGLSIKFFHGNILEETIFKSCLNSRNINLIGTYRHLDEDKISIKLRALQQLQVISEEIIIHKGKLLNTWAVTQFFGNIEVLQILNQSKRFSLLTKLQTFKEYRFPFLKLLKNKFWYLATLNTQLTWGYLSHMGPKMQLPKFQT